MDDESANEISGNFEFYKYILELEYPDIKLSPSWEKFEPDILNKRKGSKTISVLRKILRGEIFRKRFEKDLRFAPL